MEESFGMSKMMIVIKTPKISAKLTLMVTNFLDWKYYKTKQREEKEKNKLKLTEKSNRQKSIEKEEMNILRSIETMLAM